MKNTLNKLFEGAILTKEEAESTLLSIGRGGQNPHQIAAFLTCFQMRKIRGRELAGFRSAMIQLAKPINFGDFETIDLCGTGGDGKDTFNISTVSAFVVAGAGYKVAKHGNYGVSSGCGSSNVLEHLGYWFTNEEDRLKKDLEQGNFCYMHAPLFHPAMKEVGPIRKGMQVKTFFNMLGPLLNPSRPGRQITGVYHDSLIPLYKEVFEDMGSEYAIIHSVDGYDEVSLTGDFIVETKKGRKIYAPHDFTLPSVDRIDLYGGKSVEAAAEIFVEILKGNGTEEQTNVVAVNAGLAIQRFKPDADLKDCIKEALESIEKQAGYDCLRKVAT